ncbi:MAG: glycosyl transferase family protein [Bryobacteraceae bacterium]
MACLIALAAWILLSGLDDLFIGIVSFFTRGRQKPRPPQAEIERAPERRIAIFVALWREHKVTGQMLDRTISTVRYRNYDVFVGVYPNDTLTVRAVSEAASRHPRVHVAMLPHDGPTSKGDNLNWIHRRMQEYELEHGVEFDVIVTHDAEDLVHPESLRLINWYSADYAMVQVPVLALPTPAHEFTHGLYCDEFAEYQLKDIPVRQILGGFLPSNGVGCGFERKALERLAESRQGRIFDPDSLTEDYENGFRLHELGYRQIFVPVQFDAGEPIATREYFPRTRRAAVRQRSRWIAGIALQGWERLAWRAPWLQRYWFWRDRKGLVGCLLAPLANLTFVYGLIRWRPLLEGFPWMAWLYAATLVTAAFQISMRMYCSSRIYGWRFASVSPLRAFWGNIVNFHATVKAIAQFAAAHRRRQTLRWQKTDHSFPVHPLQAQGRQRLGELLVRMHCLQMEDVEGALQSLPSGSRLGEHLVQLHKLTEENLYLALSSQAGIPLGAPDDREVNRMASRMLPAEMARRWRVQPYRVDMGQLHLVTTEVPSDEMVRELAGASALDLRFRLTPPREFDKLVDLASGTDRDRRPHLTNIVA